MAENLSTDIEASDDGHAERRIASLETALKEMREERDHWRTHRATDAEAQAISACVKALDELQQRQSIRHNYGCHERVLRYLADRYGVHWPVVTDGEEAEA